MSLALTASFVAVQNLIQPLAQSANQNGLAIRVASTSSAVLGTLTASGTTAPTVVWSITQNPSWITLDVDPTTLDSLSAKKGVVDLGLGNNETLTVSLHVVAASSVEEAASLQVPGSRGLKRSCFESGAWPTKVSQWNSAAWLAGGSEFLFVAELYLQLRPCGLASQGDRS